MLQNQNKERHSTESTQNEISPESFWRLHITSDYHWGIYKLESDFVACVNVPSPMRSELCTEEGPWFCSMQDPTDPDL